MENKPTRIIALDGDIQCYAIGFKSEGEHVANALHSVKVWIDKCLRACDAEHYIIFLTGKDNFRDTRATIQPYKENRSGQEKPTHHAAIREYMIEHHGAIVIDGAEADDALGVFATDNEEGVEKVICTLDKDLDMIPGLHYNWRKDSLYEISEEEGDDFFIEQLLTGDATDNIPGLYKLTGQKATKKLKERCTSKPTFSEKVEEVMEVYREFGGGDPFKSFNEVTEIGDLLWIQRNKHKTFVEYQHDKVQSTKSEKTKSSKDKEESG